MTKKIDNELLKLVEKGIKGSLKKQDELFNSNWKNRVLFKKAKKLASY